MYAAFYGWRSFSAANLVTADVVLVRDDDWASGATTFEDLVDPGDNVAGNRVVQGVTFTWNGTLGNDRLGGDLAIAVDPRNSGTVYLAWCDVQSGRYTLHLRRSTDRGLTFSTDLRTLANAKNPAIAINEDGLVGFAYQQVTGTGAGQRWESHLETSSNAFVASTDVILSTTPASTPTPTFLPYLGDYIHMVAMGQSLFGVFSANNTPDLANFPQGVTYLRNHDFGTRQLFAVDGTTPVNVSVDPYFFRFTPQRQFTRLTRFTPFTRFTGLTRFTPFTRFTDLTRFTEFTRFTPLTRFTPFTLFTPFPGFTRAAGPGPRSGPGPRALRPLRERRVHGGRAGPQALRRARRRSGGARRSGDQRPAPAGDDRSRPAVDAGRLAPGGRRRGGAGSPSACCSACSARCPRAPHPSGRPTNRACSASSSPRATRARC